MEIPLKSLIRNLLRIVQNGAWWTQENLPEIAELNRRVAEVTSKPFAFLSTESVGPNGNSIRFLVESYDPFLDGRGLAKLATYELVPIEQTEQLEQFLSKRSSHSILGPKGLYELRESRIKEVNLELVALIENWNDFLQDYRPPVPPKDDPKPTRNKGGRHPERDDEEVLQVQTLWESFLREYAKEENKPPRGIWRRSAAHFFWWCRRKGIQDFPESESELKAYKKAFRDRPRLKTRFAEIDDES